MRRDEAGRESYWTTIGQKKITGEWYSLPRTGRAKTGFMRKRAFIDHETSSDRNETWVPVRGLVEMSLSRWTVGWFLCKIPPLSFKNLCDIWIFYLKLQFYFNIKLVFHANIWIKWEIPEYLPHSFYCFRYIHHISI